MSVVRLRDVGFAYPGADAPALAGVTLEIAAGGITWLFGPLGAGCSTLLLVMAGLAPRQTGGTRTGAVDTLGVDPASDRGRAELAGRVAYVTSVPALQLSGIAATVWEEVAFTPANLGWPLERIRAAVDAALARLDVAHLAPRAPTTLSGGELQRVVIASMLVLAPSVWLLDEPATALDTEGRAALLDLLREQADAGAAVVIASEDADLLSRATRRVVVVGGGRIVADGDPDVLLRGEEIWAGPGSTSVAALAREAARHRTSPLLAPPFPLTVDEAIARWAR